MLLTMKFASVIKSDVRERRGTREWWKCRLTFCQRKNRCMYEDDCVPHKRPKRITQRLPPEPATKRWYLMPPSLHNAMEAKAKELGWTTDQLARVFFMRGLTESGEPPGDWWFKHESVELVEDDKIEVTLRLPLPLFGDVVKFQRQDGFQTRGLALVQLLIMGLQVANNRGTGTGGRY